MEFDEYGNKYEGADEMIWFDEESVAPGNYGSNNLMYNDPGGSRSGGRYAEPPLVPRYQERRSFFWGSGYGPAGPPKQQKIPGHNDAVSFLLRCGVPHHSLSGLPNILLRLMKPESCGVCAQELNSFNVAQLHYNSKHHVRNVKKWLTQQAQAGSQGPKEIPIRARNLYCELCDIHITSKAHAESHYAGRSHRSVVEGRKPPKNPFLLQKNMEERVEKLIRREKKCLKPVQKPAAIENAKAKTESKPIPQELYCDICSTAVTCSEQMTMHLNGRRHLVKEKQHIFKMMKGETTTPNPAGTTGTAKDANAQNAEAQGAVAKSTDTQGADAKDADTQGAVAKDADTQGAVAKGADTQGAVAKGADTQEAVAKGADTQGAVANGAESQGKGETDVHEDDFEWGQGSGSWDDDPQ